MYKPEPPVFPETVPFLRLLEQHLGLALGAEKQYLVQSRLQPIARAEGLEDWRALLRVLLAQPVAALHWVCFEAMTTQETRFFRDDFCFDTLRRQVLPELVQRRRLQKSLRVWSAGTSTGQEACSLAMLLHDDFPELRSWSVRIWATDICQQTLEKAQTGVYSDQELDNGLTPDQKTRHFRRLADSQCQLTPELSRWISVARHNLLLPAPESHFDLVLMRNVLIYFGAEQKQKVLQHVHASMVPSGACLILGSSETIFQSPVFIQQKAARGSYFITHVPSC